MAIPRIGGGGFPLNLTGAFATQLPIVNTGQTASAAQFTAGVTNANNAVTLPAGGTFIVPAGTFYISPGPVTSLQFLDPVTQFWRTVGSTPLAGGFNVDSDGGNYRLANLTGCAVGALITNVGTAMTNGVGATATGLTITPSSGGATWIPVVGGTNSTAIVVTTTGTNYAFAPLLVCSPPAPGGIQMTATCTVAGGSVSTVTTNNVGAGYTSPATITVINDFRDTTGAGAVLTPGPLTGSGTLTAMYPSGAAQSTFVSLVGGHGNAISTAPTFTFSAGTSCSAVSVMNWVLTGLTVTAGGSTITTGSFLVANAPLVTGAGATGRAAGLGSGSIADAGLTLPRPAWVQPLINTGSVSTTGSIIIDPGFGFQTIPTVALLMGTGGAAPPTTMPNITALIGGISDTSFVQPF